MSNQLKSQKITQAGYDDLVAELQELKDKRKEIVERIEIAKGFGDLSENAEYKAAREEQESNEARIAKLEVTIENAEVIDESSLTTDIIKVGNIVKVKCLNDGKEYEMYIMGTKEVTEISHAKISDESPLGKALIRHAVGDIVEFEAPAGMFKYEVLKIEVPSKS